MQSDGGFSLTETVTCIAIISTLMCFSAPAIEDWQKNAEMRAQLYSFVSYLNKAKIEAIKANSFAVIEMNPTGYEVFMDNGENGGVAEDWIKQPGERSLGSVVLPQDITLKNEYPLSKTRFSGSIGVTAGHMVLEQRGGQKQKIVINVAGRIRTEKM